MSGVWQTLPGIPISASYVATNAEVQPSLGRPLSGNATTVTLNNKAGVQQLLPMAGSFSMTMIPNGQRQLMIDFNNPMNKVLFNSAADFMANYGSQVNEVSFVFNGIEIKRSFGRTSDSNSLRNLSNRKY